MLNSQQGSTGTISRVPYIDLNLFDLTQKKQKPTTSQQINGILLFGNENLFKIFLSEKNYTDAEKICQNEISLHNKNIEEKKANGEDITQLIQVKDENFIKWKKRLNQVYEAQINNFLENNDFLKAIHFCEFFIQKNDFRSQDVWILRLEKVITEYCNVLYHTNKKDSLEKYVYYHNKYHFTNDILDANSMYY